MTALQMNAELFRSLGVIAEDEGLMAKAVKYLKRLAAKKEDPTLLTREEFYANIEKAEQELAEGKGITMLPGESLEDLLERVG
ncbi:MAG: hypothetical protein IKO20_02285 [Bacteroidaceae bacterium]|nr:hypothetical protein [Bacteroidaceae bacterium]